MVAVLDRIESLDELKDYRIPFGEKRQHTYTFSKEPFNPERFKRVREERSNQGNWGEYHISPLDKFSMWGVLGETSFFFHSGTALETLGLRRGRSSYDFIAPVHHPIELVAFVNRQPYVLSDFRFYEYSVLLGARTLPEKLYHVYFHSFRTLNVGM